MLLVTIDTLRWDRLGCYGHAPGVAPVLDALARRGTRFDTAIAHVPMTAPSHASILTGLTPLRHGVRDNGGFVLPESVPRLAGTFKSAGYATAAFVSGVPLDRRFGLAAGFDVYDDRLSRGDGRTRGGFVERPADRTTDRVIAWLDGRTSPSPRAEPWLLWVHYFDPHAPYQPPGEFARRFAARPYDGEVAFADQQVGRLLASLQQRGEVDRTIVLVTADHGESLGEHGEETHGVFVYDATLRVPWIMAGPGIAANRTSRVVARGVDVMPTLVDLAGLAVPPALDGRSLVAAINGRSMGDEPAYVESLVARLHLGWAPLHGLRSAEWKFIDAPRRELYDLARDGAEIENRLDRHADRAASMARQLDAQMSAATTPSARAVPDSETAERLRALGYFAGAPRLAEGQQARDPKDGIGLINTLEGGIAAATTDPRRAVGLLRSVLAQDPGIDLARRQLAVALVGLREYRRAIVEIERLQHEEAAKPEDLILKSEALRVLGREQDAATALEEAERLDPRSPEAPLTAARSLAISNRFEEAGTAYRRALALSPENAEALTGLGDVALARGDLAAAARFFEQVLARDPTDVAARVRLGATRAREGRLGEAVSLFGQAVDEDPTNGDALAGLGAALARGGRPTDAVPYFERAIDAGQRTPAIFNGLGFARLESGDRAGALSALRASLALRPDQPQVSRVVRDLSERRSAPEAR